MTWLFTAQVAALALAIGGAGYFYARALAQPFDRRFGPEEPVLPRPAGPADRTPPQTL